MSEVKRTTSFTLSPKKYLVSSTRRQSFSIQVTPGINMLIDGSENNDEAERRERQLNRLHLQRNSLGTGSPSGTPLEKRKSLCSVAGLTNQQLTDHYARCIQLSAENKINIRNAFDLQLIDYMTEMVKRKNSDLNNFQVASCTLDASTKIYAYRVDSIHTDTIKIAGGLGRTKDKSEEGEAVTAETQTKRKNKMGKRHCTLETNLKNLDIAHFDLEFDVDPLFRKTAAQFDEGGTGGGQFLNSLQLLDDSCRLVIDSETVLMGLQKITSLNMSELVSIPCFPDMNRLISPTFSTFNFCNWNLNDNNDLSDYRKDSEDAEHAFDLNAVPEPFEEGGDCDSDDYEGVDDDGLITAEDTAVTIGKEAFAQKIRSTELGVMHLKDHLASVKLEYSYFDTRIVSAWAGPGHWRLKQLMKERKRDTKSSSKKKNITLDYASDSFLEQQFRILKNPTKLTKNTVKNWNSSQTTLPADLHYDPDNFYKLYLRQQIYIRRHFDDNSAEGDNTKTANNCSRSDVGSDRGNDAESIDAGLENDTEVMMDTIFPNQSCPNVEGETIDFCGENLVEAPNKVATINIAYARTAKKIDMKKLKSTIWALLTNDQNNKENERTQLCKEKTSEGTGHKLVLFSALLRDLPPSLPFQDAKHLSVPLAFIALLHLANEHSLNLKSIEEQGDFTVSLDAM